VGCGGKRKIIGLSVAVAVEDGRRKFIRHVRVHCTESRERCAGFGGIQCLKEAEDEDFFQQCPKGMIAVGLRGASGKFVDSLGLICDKPPEEPFLDDPVVGLPKGDVTTDDPEIIVKPKGGVAKYLAHSFSGTWDTVTGGRKYRMQLEQSGGQVQGSYTGGTIQGTIDGKGRLVFSWAEGASRGTGIFVLSTDKFSFSGHYSNNDDPNNVTAAWSGERIN
jgi:hypothetical protein